MCSQTGWRQRLVLQKIYVSTEASLNVLIWPSAEALYVCEQRHTKQLPLQGVGFGTT